MIKWQKIWNRSFCLFVLRNDFAPLWWLNLSKSWISDFLMLYQFPILKTKLIKVFRGTKAPLIDQLFFQYMCLGGSENLTPKVLAIEDHIMIPDESYNLYKQQQQQQKQSKLTGRNFCGPCISTPQERQKPPRRFSRHSKKNSLNYTIIWQ